MVRRALVTVALTLGTFAAAAPVSAAPMASVTKVAHATDCYRKHGNHWDCVTPGAYCPAAAHGKYGYTGTTTASRRYKCSYYSSNGRWRWKRA